MIDENEVKRMMDRTGLPEDYIRSMLGWKERQEQREKEVAPMAAALGLTPQEYISKMEQREVDLAFFQAKGFDPTTEEGLKKIKAWLETADPDELMLGEPTGDPFDITMGSVRRGPLLETVETELKKKKMS